MRSIKFVGGVALALLLTVVLGYLSAFVSRGATEDRIARSIAAAMRKEVAPAVYVWPSVAPDSASILERNGVATQLCPDPASPRCYPQAYLYRSVVKQPFVTAVRWQYSRDYHGVGGTRRFLVFFGWVYELRPQRTFIQ
jgi:hypothetical protein